MAIAMWLSIIRLEGARLGFGGMAARRRYPHHHSKA